MPDVAFDRDGLAVLALDLGYDLVGGRLVGGIADDDAKAALGCGNRGSAANAAATAGDDNNPVRQNRPRLLNRDRSQRCSGKLRPRGPELKGHHTLRDRAPVAPGLPGSP